MANDETYKQKITRIKESIEYNKPFISEIIANYKSNINDINTKINSITDNNWIDDVEVEYSSYIDSLKNGIIVKLNNSIDTTDGSLTTFEKLINDLEEKCNDYLKAISDNNTAYIDLAFDESNNNFYQPETVIVKDLSEFTRSNIDITNLNTQFSNLVTNIEDILKQLKELRFESVTAYESAKDYDFSNLQKSNDNKNNILPEPEGHRFESSDEDWIIFNDNTKTYMDGEKDPLTGITSPDTGNHNLWAYNKATGELVRIDGYDLDFSWGFAPSTYTFTLPSGKKITTTEYEPAYGGVATHIKQYYPETLKDKWILRHVDASKEKNEAVYEEFYKQYQEAENINLGVKENTQLRETIYNTRLPDTYIFYNPVTGEEIQVEEKDFKMTEKEDKYIIEYNNEEFIVYKDNSVDWDMSNMKYYNETKDLPVITN